MSFNPAMSWLDDNALSTIADRRAPNPSMMTTKYDATCPSEFYRGYATIVSQVSNSVRTIASPKALYPLVDQFDRTIKALPSDERRNGAGFALANVAGYVQNGTVAQISTTLAEELVCIAHCFIRNKARGL